MKKESRGMQILRLSNEISLIDYILTEGYEKTLTFSFEEDKDIVLSYKDKTKEEMIESRTKLEKNWVLYKNLIYNTEEQRIV